MTHEEPARESRRKVWTGPRLALAATAFALLSVALSPGCNPTDSSANVSAPAARATPASAAPAATPAVLNPIPRASRPASGVAPTPMPDPPALPPSVVSATLKDTEGKSFKLSDYEGKVVVLNLWATWCGPCRREIPEFIEMREEFKGRDVEILGVTMEDERNTAADVTEFIEEFGINYRIAWVDLDFYRTMLSPGFEIPQTYVLGKDGRVVYKFVGYNAQVGSYVRSIVNQSL